MDKWDIPTLLRHFQRRRQLPTVATHFTDHRKTSVDLNCENANLDTVLHAAKLLKIVTAAMDLPATYVQAPPQGCSDVTFFAGMGIVQN